MKKFVFLLSGLLTFNAYCGTNIFEDKIETLQKGQTRYVDFQIFGDTFADVYTKDNSKNTVLYTRTNIDTDFNLSNNLSVDTRFQILNTSGGVYSPFASQNYANNNQTTSAFFGGNSFSMPVLAVNIKTPITQVLVGKILPRSGVGASRYNPVFNNDWYGVYGTNMNFGYANQEKIGAQAEFHKEFRDDDIYNLQFALYKNDTTFLGTQNMQTNGLIIPQNIAHITTKNIAGDTTIPQSFSLSFNGKTHLSYKNDIVYYAFLFRRNNVSNSGEKDMFASETSFIFSGAFEKDLYGINAGTFGELAYINNSYGIKNLNSQYFTFALYSSLEKVSVSFAYNLYTSPSLGNLQISRAYLSQTSVGIGYAFEKFALFLAYRNFQDNQSGKSFNGIGLNYRYNIGTKNTPFNKM